MNSDTPKNIYFASDMHLGAPNHQASLVREKRFVEWLNHITPKTAELFLVGDIFDFWFEYRHVAPKGYVRLLGKLAEMSDSGIKIHIFSGNHDIWYGPYLAEQLAAEIHRGPVTKTFFGKNFYIAHGDGLGPGDYGYKLLKWFLSTRLTHAILRFMHPDWAIGLATWFSRMSNSHNYDGKKEKTIVPLEKERLYIHANELVKEQPELDYMVFGHRHIVLEEAIGEKATCFFLGVCIEFDTYLEIRPDGASLKNWSQEKIAVVSE